MNPLVSGLVIILLARMELQVSHISIQFTLVGGGAPCFTDVFSLIGMFEMC